MDEEYCDFYPACGCDCENECEEHDYPDAYDDYDEDGNYIPRDW